MGDLTCKIAITDDFIIVLNNLTPTSLKGLVQFTTEHPELPHSIDQLFKEIQSNSLFSGGVTIEIQRPITTKKPVK